MYYFFKRVLAFIYFWFFKLKIISMERICNNDYKIIRIRGEEGEKKNYNEEIPKIVWMFWDGELPLEINVFYKKIKQDNPGWDIRMLNFDTINYYIDSYVDWKNLKMPLANITDYIRIKLLYEYGGLWLDSSIIFNKQLDELIPIDNCEYNLIGFYRGKSTIDYTYPVIESWFLASPKGNYFIKKIIDIYEPVLSIGSEEYFRKLKKRIDYAEIKQGISPPEYLIFYLAVQIAMRECKNFSLYLYCADDTAYLLQDTLGWRSHKSTAFLFVQDKPDIEPIMYKLTHGDRQYFDIMKKFNLINKNSIMGELYGRYV